MKQKAHQRSVAYIINILQSQFTILEWHHYLERRLWLNMFIDSSIRIVIMFIVQAIVAVIVNYNRNMTVQGPVTDS